MARQTWKRVSRREPCPICRHADWCTIAPDGTAVCCMRTQSDRALDNGGWLHWIKDRPVRPLPAPAKSPHRGNVSPEFDALAVWVAYRQATDQVHGERHAKDLGVSWQALWAIGAAWAADARAWAFPMRDGDSDIVGIRLRAEDGRKWAVRGSRAGLIYDPSGMGPLVLICEGPTDTAAAMDLGFAAVGRPSCRGQVDLLRQYLRRHRGDVVIVADHDTPKDRPDGSTWRPGLDGALDLAKDLGRPSRIILPPAKDIRAWKAAGATDMDVLQAIRNAAWQGVK